MEEKIQHQFLEQIDQVLDKFMELTDERGSANSISTSNKYRFVTAKERQMIITLCRSIIERVSGTSSSYYKDLFQIMSSKKNDGLKADHAMGIIESLRFDIESGYLTNFEELIHGEIFGDFLEMARHLLNEKYKDAAAVIVGSSLEAHLLQLCKKYDIALTFTNSKREIKNKKADRLNADLATVKAYSKLDQKSITAWLDLRNKAAHGKYTEYTHDQVSLMTDGIRDYISRNPA